MNALALTVCIMILLKSIFVLLEAQKACDTARTHLLECKRLLDIAHGEHIAAQAIKAEFLTHG